MRKRKPIGGRSRRGTIIESPSKKVEEAKEPNQHGVCPLKEDGHTQENYEKEKEEEEIFLSLRKFKTLNEINKSFGIQQQASLHQLSKTLNSSFLGSNENSDGP